MVGHARARSRRNPQQPCEYPRVDPSGLVRPPKSAAIRADASGRIHAFRVEWCVVPAAESILSWATAVANDWRWVAVGWHIALVAGFLIALVSRSRPSQRLVGALLVLPVISVSVVAWLSGNPFNGLTFAGLAAVLARAAMRFPTSAVTQAPAASVGPGIALVTLGWFYPHFLNTDSWMAYAYASPFGILPCPTLSVVIGITLIGGGLRATAWSAPLFMAGTLYGVLGVFTLRVTLDIWLLAGAVLLGALSAVDLLAGPVRATADERTRRLPGDEFVPTEVGALTHAITITGSPARVWPWLVQMGAGSRAGWYSYDFLDNGRQPSASRIVSEWQHITVGTVFPALPGVTEGFVVLAFEPRRSLILGWPNAEGGAPTVTWAFVLESRSARTTRLIVRVRAGQGYRFHGLPVWLSSPVIGLEHFVMQRKQLLEIARRVEASQHEHAHAA